MKEKLDIRKVVFRVVFAGLFGLVGLYAAHELAVNWHALATAVGAMAVVRNWLLPAAGAVLGIAVSPLLLKVFERLVTAVEDAIASLAPAEALSGAIGLIVGLIVSFFVRDIFRGIDLIPRFGPMISLVLYILITLFFSYLGVRVGLRQRLSSWTRATIRGGEAPAKLLDTSVIIDGRILEIVQAGFMDGRLLVPKFVLKELQNIADSVDAMRRSRGRRGLEILNRLREVSGNLEVYEGDVSERDVDSKLVSVARNLRAQVLTNDYNLNRVARLQGVTVLNINELANALKPVVLPGEEMAVSIVKDGKEQNQGIGYLEDGTMIVVENGRPLKGEQVSVQVTSVLQTAAGRMIFGKVKK